MNSKPNCFGKYGSEGSACDNLCEDETRTACVNFVSPWKLEYEALLPAKKEMADAYGQAFPETWADLMSGHIANSDFSEHLTRWEGFKAAWRFLKFGKLGVMPYEWTPDDEVV